LFLNVKQYLPFLLILSFILISSTASATFNVWLTSDHHVDCKTGGEYEWKLALEDTTDFSFNISLVLGDLITGQDDDNLSLNFTGKLFLFRNLTQDNMPSGHTMNDFYSITGNHEVRWVNGISNDAFHNWLLEHRTYFKYRWNEIADPFGNNESISYINNSNRIYPVDYSFIGLENGSELMYTIQTGNVLYIMIGPNLTAPCDHGDNTPGVRGSNYSYAFPYFTSIVENNTDKNIIVCTHHPPYIQNFSGYIDISRAVDPKFTDWLGNNTHTVNAWLFGHKHYNDGDTRYAKHGHNFTAINIAGIDDDHSGTERHSYLLNFTVSDKNVSIADYYHDTHSFDAAGNPGNMDTAFVLSYDFQRGIPACPDITDETPANNSIDILLDIGNLSVNISDDNGDAMTWTIECNNTNSSNGNDNNGTIQCPVVLAYNTTYTWWVNVTDGTCWTNRTFTFNTTNIITTQIIINHCRDTYSNIEGQGDTIFILIGTVILISSILLIVGLFKKLNFL